MSSRAWIAILGMGLGSVVILGLLTKVAVESSPELQAMIRFKAALAEELAPTGVEAVSMRRSKARRGLVLSLAFPRASTAGLEPTLKPTCEPTLKSSAERATLDQTVAEFLLAHFEGEAGGVLEIDYQTSPSWGCEGTKSRRQALVPLAPVRVRLADRKASSVLSARFETSRQARLLGYVRSERELAVEIETPLSFAGDAKSLAFDLEPEIRLAFGGNLYHLLRVQVTAAKQLEAALSAVGTSHPLEVRFDRVGRELDAHGKPTGRRAASAPASRGSSVGSERAPSTPAASSPAPAQPDQP